MSDAMEARPIRIATFTTLFPNSVQPVHGIFVQNRLHHLIATGRVTSRVIAPVPWFPRPLQRLFPSYPAYSRVPAFERRDGFSVIHPRFPVLPKVGMSLAPGFLYLSCRSTMQRLLREGDGFDLIDAHYFYPDGVAAIWLGKALNKPVVITARGTDINLIPRFRVPRMLIQYAAQNAAAIITVSQALKDELVVLGVPASRMHVLRNGVDLGVFRPWDRSIARNRFAVSGPTLLSVGHLIERKGHDLVIGALPALPDYSLLVVGEGPERTALERLAAKLGVASRVKFLGHIAHAELAQAYSAADALVLASSREGWPNVLLEAMACGTPVVASNIWGNPEVVTEPIAGELMAERTPDGIVAAVEKLFLARRDRAATRRYAEQFSWDATTQGQVDLFSEILRADHRSLVSLAKTG